MYQSCTTVLYQSGTTVCHSGTKLGLASQLFFKIMSSRGYCIYRNGSEEKCLAPGSLRSSTGGTRTRQEKEKENTMSKKNVVFALFGLAMALAITPAATADSFSFTYSGPVTSGPAGTVTLDGIFTTSTPYGPNGGDIVTSFTGTYSDTGDGVSGVASLYPGVGTDESYLTSKDGLWLYDNLYYPGKNAPNTSGGQFDYYGLMLYVGPSSDPKEWEVNFWANTDTTYQFEEALVGEGLLSSSTGIGIADGDGSTGPSITPTPEPGSLFLLGTGLLGLALVAFRKRTASVHNLIS